MRGGLIGRTARKLSHILTAPVQVAIRKVKRMVSPESFSSKVLSDVRKGISQKKGKKERTIQDYFSIGRYYVLKRMVYVVMSAVLIFPVLSYPEAVNALSILLRIIPQGIISLRNMRRI